MTTAATTTDSGHAHRILLVDDLDDTREATGYILEHAGFAVDTARGGEDALRRFREGLRPCVMLLDIRMPGMSGWDLWERMRAEPELADIAVIIVSGDMEQRERAHRVGIAEFLTKPVDFERLIAMIHRHCGH